MYRRVVLSSIALRGRPAEWFFFHPWALVRVLVLKIAFPCKVSSAVPQTITNDMTVCMSRILLQEAGGGGVNRSKMYIRMTTTNRKTKTNNSQIGQRCNTNIGSSVVFVASTVKSIQNKYFKFSKCKQILLSP